MYDIRTFGFCMIFAVIGGVTMYQWLSVPRSQKEKDRVLKLGLAILLGSIVLLIVMPFVPSACSKVLDGRGAQTLLLLVLIVSLFGNRQTASKTPEEKASARRVFMLVMIGTIILLVFCSIIWFPFLK